MVSLDRCAMEVMDSSMAVTGGMDSDSIAEEDLSHGSVSLNLTLLAEVAVLGECVHDRGNAAGDADGVSPEDSAALADNRCMGPDDHDMADARVDCHASESDEDCSGDTTCLEACMTPSGQDYYLWRGVGALPRRRSALRLSRIIARQQLLRRLSQGRNKDYCEIFVDFFNFKTSVCDRVRIQTISALIKEKFQFKGTERPCDCCFST